MVTSYNMIRDRERRHSKAPNMYGYAYLIAYAKSIEVNDDNNDPYKL